MRKNNLVLTILLSLISTQSFASKGINKVNEKQVEEASCMLLTKYDDLAGKEGVCSATLINSTTLLTAKHCLYNKPSQMQKGENDPIRRAFKSEEIIAKEKMSIICGQSIFTPKSFQIHPHTDIAKIQIDNTDKELSNLQIATKDEIKDFIKNTYKNQCAIFGFGLNNDNEMRIFNGVKADSIEIYRVQDAYIEIEMDSDFKNLSLYFANSMLDTIYMNQYFFPKLSHFAAQSQIPQAELEKVLENFIYRIKMKKLRVSSIYDPKKGPLFKELFFKHFKNIYHKAYSSVAQKIVDATTAKKLSLHRIILNVESETLEKAGMDYGDSGGAFSCLINNEWKLVGVNSKIHIDSNLGYIARPWEPMHSKPKSRLTKNGEAGLLSRPIVEWINNSSF